MKHPYRVVSDKSWVDSFQSDYPDAVHNKSKTEYMLSCNDGSGGLTRKEAQDYIANNWNITEYQNQQT